MGINMVNIIMSQDDYYTWDEYYSYNGRNGGSNRGTRRTNKLTFFMIGMVLFIVVFMPIYGTTLRYYIGTSFRLVFDYLGNIFQTVGGLILMIVAAECIFFRKISFSGMTIGFLLLYMGAFLTGGTLFFLGMVYQLTSAPGFH